MLVSHMAKKKKLQTIHTKFEEVIIKEAAAMELNTRPDNIRSHVHMHYLGTQVNRMNLLSKEDLEFIKNRLRKKK